MRIAGVNVGEVTATEAKGDAVEVTFTVDDEGQPIHEDAEVEIRPRLFLEGNFFLDLRPGSPSAAELPDDGEIPAAQTATAVQLDEVLTSLQSRLARATCSSSLKGYGTALTYEPTRRGRRRPGPRRPRRDGRGVAKRLVRIRRAGRQGTPRSSPMPCGARSPTTSPADRGAARRASSS